LEELLKRLEEMKNMEPGVQPRVESSTPPTIPPTPELQSSPAPDGQPELAKEPSEDALPVGVVAYPSRRSDLNFLGTTLIGTPLNKLADAVRMIVDLEGPIHADELARACAENFGTKATARPREAIDRSVKFAVANGWIVTDGSFVRSALHTDTQIRFRGKDCPVTNPEMIPPEEFEAAVMLVLHQQFGLKLDALIEAVSRAFGFARTGTKLKSAIVRLDQRGEIQQDAAEFVTLKSAVKG
jgi:hypothetical protein